MHLQCDYRNDLDKMDELFFQNECIEELGIMSENELQHYMEYIDMQASQYRREANLSKIKRTMALYESLKNLAFINNGFVSLDVDEEQMKATMIYKGTHLFFINDKNEALCNILLPFLKNCSLICLEPQGEEMIITIKCSLYDEIMVEDKENELDRIRDRIKRKDSKC